MEVGGINSGGLAPGGIRNFVSNKFAVVCSEWCMSSIDSICLTVGVPVL